MVRQCFLLPFILKPIHHQSQPGSNRYRHRNMHNIPKSFQKDVSLQNQQQQHHHQKHATAYRKDMDRSWWIPQKLLGQIKLDVHNKHQTDHTLQDFTPLKIPLTLKSSYPMLQVTGEAFSSLTYQCASNTSESSINKAWDITWWHPFLDYLTQ